jgi:tetratricopeptide (TPR) repeat protein
VLTKGHKNGFAKLVKGILNALDDSKLDPRSSELRQHLNDARPREALIEFARRLETSQEGIETYKNLPTTLLRQIANSLKLEGCMQQAFHCFSLAYKRDPRNAHLLYEMARFFRSLGAINHPRLLSRSNACLRLAAYLAKDQPRLLERIGETYFERLEYKHAARCFLKALGMEPNLYRANIGLAEIALRDGKLAHVAHFYSAAAIVTGDRAQRDLAMREANYYTRLCSDEDYFEAEISRITKLQNFQWARNSSALLLFIFWMLALLSGRFSNELGSLAWSAVITTSLVWLGSVLLSFHYGQRHQ